ncbi:MAG: peptidase inhibitor family I36 protein [Thiothrix sp.]|nr:peptidase inhibitor family I36 protein [Thiothrix sp.]
MNMSKAGLVIGLSLLTTTAAQATCQVYEHINYGGAVRSLASGQKIANVGGAWNDRISSVRLSNSCRLIAYQHINYQGDRRVFGADTRFVGNLWNDQISSLQCQCPEPPRPACQMYEHANFAGGVLPVRGNMAWVGDNWNDKVSAVKVPSSCSLTVYQHINYGGDSRTFGPGSTAYIGNLWNDQISSARCSCR